MATRMIGGKLRSDRRGSVALEMALMFPLVAIVLLGFTELYFYARAVVISERVAFASADMLAKRQFLVDCTSTASSANLGTHILAAETMAQPLDFKANGMLIINAVEGGANGPSISWQRRTTYTLPGISSELGKEGAAPVLPPKLTVRPIVGTQQDTLIVVELFYRMQPFKGVRTLLPDLPLDVTITRKAYSRGRWGGLAKLQKNASCPTLPKP